MSNATREINRITTAIIRISMKLIVYALIILLLYEAVIKGYAFGHQIFYAEAVEEAPGHDMTVTIEPDTSVSEAAQLLADDGLIASEFAFIFQSKFYDYDTVYPGVYNLNTSMTSKEILQALNVKPETEETEAAQKAGARLKTTQDQAAPASAEADGQAAPAARTADAGGSGASGSGGSGTTGGAAENGSGADVPAAAAAGQDGQPAADGQAAQGAENSGTGAGEDTFDDEEGEVGGWIQDVEGAGQ